MEKAQKIKENLLTCLFIGLCFLLTGAEYITWWLYKLVPNFTSDAADLLSEGIGYLFQVLGLLLFAFLIKKAKEIIQNRLLFPILIVLDFLFCILAFFVEDLALILIFGFLMNLFHGFVAGYYLTKLSMNASKARTGIVFGLGYAFGSIVTFILSSILKGSLGSPYILVVYFLLAIACILCDYFPKTEEHTSGFSIKSFESDTYTPKQIALAAIIVLLLSFVKNIGFYFPTEDYVTGAVSPIFIRLFYAIGLILAGFINDKSRRYGSICCICALVFPFLVLSLEHIAVAGIIAWVLGYIFFGFFSVYRVVIFSDISRSTPEALYLAGFGLMFGRLGDATSSMFGIALNQNVEYIILLATLLFITTIIIYFQFYNQVYVVVIPRLKNQEDVFHDFLKAYDISHRETEVLRQLLDGLSNSEIAAKLYISESTVKFHVRNILKKTNCNNRTEIITLYEQLK